MKPTVKTTSPNGSKADTAYETIRRAIIGLDLPPGEQVSEPQLASQFDLGRAAVRAALTRLRHEQLVHAIPRQGYRVAPITIKQVADLFGARLIIEPALARLAAGRTTDEIAAELDRLNQACARPPDQGSPETMKVLRQANTTFHVAVARASGNERLAEVLEVLLDEMERVLYLPQIANLYERVDASIPEHNRIIKALRAGDAKEAERATYEHIIPNKDFVMEGLVSSPQLRSINLISG